MERLVEDEHSIYEIDDACERRRMERQGKQEELQNKSKEKNDIKKNSIKKL